MKRALGVSALCLAVVACSSSAETPKSSLPTVSAAPSIEDRILVCQSDEDGAVAAVSRCVTSDVDPDALAGTLARWGKAQPFWTDALFDTVSFAQRYVLRDGERECLRRAFCRQMPFEER